MTKKSELSPKNYKRIFYINCLLCVPLLILFAWPYVIFNYLLFISPEFFYPASLLFSLPFTLTILHGHVTLALGSAHRHHYYNWLKDHAMTYGLFFHPVFISTRFRLVVLALSVIIFIVGWLVKG